MDKDCRKALACGAELRGQLNDIVEEVMDAIWKDDKERGEVARRLTEKLSRLDLYGRCLPLPPLEGESFEQALERIFGKRIPKQVG